MLVAEMTTKLNHVCHLVQSMHLSAFDRIAFLVVSLLHVASAPPFSPLFFLLTLKNSKKTQTKPYGATHETQEKLIVEATVLQLEQKISFKNGC